MKSLRIVLAAVVLGGAAVAAGLYVRGRVDASSPALITVTQSQTDRASRGQRQEFWLYDTDGVRRGIAEWDGKLVVMNFWATWCPPCLHEIPVFIALQERYGERGVQFLGIAIDEADRVREFAEKIGLNYPTLHGQLDAIEVMTAYGNETGGLPYTVVIDRSGTIVARHAGVLDEATATDLIDDLLGDIPQ